MENIPPEILVPHILILLSEKDLNAMRGMNRRYRNIIDNNASLLYARVIQVKLRILREVGASPSSSRFFISTTGCRKCKLDFFENHCTSISPKRLESTVIGNSVEECMKMTLRGAAETHLMLSGHVSKDVLPFISSLLLSAHSLHLECVIDVDRELAYHFLFSPKRSLTIRRWNEFLQEDAFYQDSGAGLLDIWTYREGWIDRASLDSMPVTGRGDYSHPSPPYTITEQQLLILASRSDLIDIRLHAVQGIHFSWIRRIVQKLLSSVGRKNISLGIENSTLRRWHGRLYEDKRDRMGEWLRKIGEETIHVTCKHSFPSLHIQYTISDEFIERTVDVSINAAGLAICSV